MKSREQHKTRSDAIEGNPQHSFIDTAIDWAESAWAAVSEDPAPGVQEKRPPGISRRWALIALALVGVLIVVVVGAAAVLNRPGAGPASSPGDQSAYAQLFAQIGPNGEVTKEMALEAFSLAIAPLPGVTVPSGPPPADYERMDGTFAINWIRPYLDQITPEQKAAVDAALAPNPNAPVITPGLTATVLGPLDDLFKVTQDADLDTYYGYVNTAAATIAGKLGRQLHVGWSVEINTVPQLDAFNDLSKCEIHVNPSLQSLKDSADLKAAMAHEIFHCYQFDYFDQHGGLRSVPNWMEEGQAEWAGENVGGPSNTGADWWAKYFATIGTALFARSYDAVGFYQHMAEKGLDPWAHFDAMLGSTTALDAFKVTGATADDFLDTWSSGEFRDQSLGAPWYATGPWAISASAPAQEVDLGIHDDVHVATDVLYNRDVKLVSSADIVEVRMNGHVRMRTDPDGNETDTEQRWLCTEALGCKCPPNKRYSGPELEIVSPTVEFGLTGALTGASGTLVGHETDEFCKPLPTPEGSVYPGGSKPPDKCAALCANSNGDPHLRTVNGYKYEFQAAGEFVLLKSPDSSVEIQARQVPWTGSSSYRGISSNRAIAALVNGHRVGVYVNGDGFDVHVDGQAVDPAGIPDLGAGAAIKQVDGGFEIDFPDGTVLWTLSLGVWGINAIVQPSDSLATGGMGLVGPVTPGGMGVPLLPDGTQMPATPDFDARHAALYGQFADAWRVTDSTSLFDYDSGKSTASYTDHNFPSDADDAALAAALANPDQNQQVAAQSACSSVTDPDLLANCQFDVYATGDAGFAQQYAVQQSFYDNGAGVGGPSAPPATFGPVTGAQQVTELQDLLGSTIGPDNTLYVSLDTSAGANELLAIDPTTAAIKQQVPMRVATDIHFAAGSIWAAGQTADANGGYCTVTRYDPVTLAGQTDFPVTCAAGSVPHLTSVGDSVWFVDTTNVDSTTGAGAVLTRIDPGTNAADKSVPLGDSGGCCTDSQGAVFCSCGQSDVWRLTASDSGFVDMGGYTQIYPAGTGFWTETHEVTDSASFVSGPGTVSVSMPLDNGRVVGGDSTGVYLQDAIQDAGVPDDQLSRQASDGSAPVFLAAPPTTGSGFDATEHDYLTGGFPWFATTQGYLHLWEFKATPDSPLALWLQWAPLP